MENTAIEVWVYGVIMILGGIAGFVRVGSKASLISGVGFGLVLLVSGFGVWRGSQISLVAAVGHRAPVGGLIRHSLRQEAAVHAGGNAGDPQPGGRGDVRAGVEAVTGEYCLDGS